MMRSSRQIAIRQHVLTFIQAYVSTHVNAPTLREICQHCGVSSLSVARRHVLALIESGDLVRTKQWPLRFTTRRALDALSAVENSEAGANV